MNELERVDGYLGLARRGGYLLFGETAIIQAKAGRVVLLLIASDISASSRKLVDHDEVLNNTIVINYGTKASLGALMNKGAIAIIGIKNRGIAKQIRKILEDSPYGKTQQ